MPAFFSGKKSSAERTLPRSEANACAMTATPPARRIVDIASSGVGAR